MEEKLYWLAFSFFPGVGPVKFKKLLNHFGSAKKAWEGREKDLKKILGEKLGSELLSLRTQISPKAYAEKLQKLNIKTLILTDKEYPALLKQIPNPPFVLYIKGSHLGGVISSDSRTIGIVGTRKITEYGRTVTEL